MAPVELEMVDVALEMVVALDLTTGVDVVAVIFELLARLELDVFVTCWLVADFDVDWDVLEAITVGLEFVVAGLSEALTGLAPPIDVVGLEMAGVVFEKVSALGLGMAVWQTGVLGLEVVVDVVDLATVEVDSDTAGVALETCAMGLEMSVVLEVVGVALEVIRVRCALAPAELEMVDVALEMVAA
jgi:hypothetical protein